ncbi:helix-turn-helix domain-containing protein [Labilibaculum sp. A4]|uniref:helix-turn-helix domain-containing protein n=1 Tax=Labilibaculum euxinus TaxID=2686357 RepID=UPI000F625665|nr:helix-turn-helix transcriptional regulator [Labilibaculum euxinus]MDQ1771667.1 helix-turn-helix transcriptional regulator [Labilibaculum euxinus]MWN77344.1 helix-turn-helix domain-containing protein [Labilibaculum euxinus]
MTEIGKRIKEIRIKRGLTQEDLAESAKINLRTIQRIEKNDTTPRGKTLKLIFEVLNIEVIEIEKEKRLINKQLIWSAFFTLLILISTFLAWFKVKYEVPMEWTGEKMFSIATSTGWDGNINFIGFDFQNWFLSISSLTIGLIVLSHSLGLIENKIKYISLQLVCVFLYLIALVGEKIDIFRPGLFIVIVATIFLVIIYRKKKETVANKSNRCTTN